MKDSVAAKAVQPAAAASTNVFSFYRHHARRCELAARSAPNQEVRAVLCKMIQVWREFAEEHERIASERCDLNIDLGQKLEDGMTPTGESRRNRRI